MLKVLVEYVNNDEGRRIELDHCGMLQEAIAQVFDIDPTIVMISLKFKDNTSRRYRTLSRKKK